jgi:hypothetical protein
LELVKVRTSTASMSPARSANGWSAARMRAVAYGDGCFFWPKEKVSKPL